MTEETKITRTSAEKLHDELSRRGCRMIWRVPADVGEILAYNTPSGVALVHDYGKHGFDLYIQWQRPGTHIDAACAVCGGPGV